jgi:hypothetical protein
MSSLDLLETLEPIEEEFPQIEDLPADAKIDCAQASAVLAILHPLGFEAFLRPGNGVDFG